LPKLTRVDTISHPENHDRHSGGPKNFSRSFTAVPLALPFGHSDRVPRRPKGNDCCRSSRYSSRRIPLAGFKLTGEHTYSRAYATTKYRANYQLCQRSAPAVAGAALRDFS
jgi:hypothetical protein